MCIADDLSDCCAKFGFEQETVKILSKEAQLPSDNPSAVAISPSHTPAETLDQLGEKKTIPHFADKCTPWPTIQGNSDVSIIAVHIA